MYWLTPASPSVPRFPTPHAQMSTPHVKNSTPHKHAGKLPEFESKFCLWKAVPAAGMFADVPKQAALALLFRKAAEAPLWVARHAAVHQNVHPALRMAGRDSQEARGARGEEWRGGSFPPAFYTQISFWEVPGSVQRMTCTGRGRQGGGGRTPFICTSLIFKTFFLLDRVKAILCSFLAHSFLLTSSCIIQAMNAS